MTSKASLPFLSLHPTPPGPTPKRWNELHTE